ncbi:hypothetical protein CDAR_17071, partial [Caerostris darwini]
VGKIKCSWWRRSWNEVSKFLVYRKTQQWGYRNIAWLKIFLPAPCVPSLLDEVQHTLTIEVPSLESAIAEHLVNTTLVVCH